MSNVSITFEYDAKAIRDPLVLGTFDQDQISQEFDILIKHNSNKPIRQCAFYTSVYDAIYDGSNSAKSDYERLIWFANNFEEYGLSVKQNYTIFGEVFQQEAARLIDVTREEETNFFTGHEIEILSGPVTGEKRTVLDYDVSNSLFFLDSDFSVPPIGERYRMDIETLDYIKSGSGTTAETAIPLLFNGGKIDRFEEARITLQLRVPPFMKTSGINHINFNMKFTPEE